MALHIDEVCCWCEGTSCRDRRLEERVGHGPHAPAGDVSLRYAAAARSAARLITRKAGVAKPKVSPEDVNVLRMFAAGQKPAEIARALGTSPEFVHTKVARIRRRLGARTVPHAVAIAASLKLL